VSDFGEGGGVFVEEVVEQAGGDVDGVDVVSVDEGFDGLWVGGLAGL
jgi:hypothetical protein